MFVDVDGRPLSRERRRVRRCAPAGFDQMPGMGFGFGSDAAPFPPLSIQGLVLWLRADLGITIGTGVSAWADQSGAGNNVTQGTGANQPGFAAAGAPNGLPCITLSGSQLLTGSTAPFSPTSCTFFIVHKFTAVNFLQCSYQCGQSNNGLATAVDGSAVSDRDIALQGVAYVTGGTCTTSWEQWTITGASAPAQVLRVNGSQVGTGTFTPLAPSAAQAVGAAQAAQQNMTGSIAEAIAYSRVLAAPEIARVESYLLARYGV